MRLPFATPMSNSWSTTEGSIPSTWCTDEPIFTEPNFSPDAILTPGTLARSVSICGGSVLPKPEVFTM